MSLALRAARPTSLNPGPPKVTGAAGETTPTEKFSESRQRYTTLFLAGHVFESLIKENLGFSATHFDLRQPAVGSQFANASERLCILSECLGIFFENLLQLSQSFGNPGCWRDTLFRTCVFFHARVGKGAGH